MFNLTLALHGGGDGTPFIRIRQLSADRTVQIARIFYLGVMLLTTGPATKRKICAIVKGLHRYRPYASPSPPKSGNRVSQAPLYTSLVYQAF